MEQFVSQDPRSYSLYFDLNIWFRARKVTGTFEKRAPDELLALPGEILGSLAWGPPVDRQLPSYF